MIKDVKVKRKNIWSLILTVSGISEFVCIMLKMQRNITTSSDLQKECTSNIKENQLTTSPKA